MRTWVWLATTTLLVACRPGSDCDRQQLRALAETLGEDRPAHVRGRMAAGGILEACESALPDAAKHYLAGSHVPPPAHRHVPELHELLLDACPEYETEVVEHLARWPNGENNKTRTFDACGFSEFGVMTRWDAVSRPAAWDYNWSLHKLMLDDGVPPQIARPITRGLFDFEREVWGKEQLESGHSLPRARTGRAWNPHDVRVVASGDALRWRGEELAPLREGELDPQLVDDFALAPLLVEFEALAEVERAPEGRPPLGIWNLVLVADEDLPFATARVILHTARLAGFGDVGLMVDVGRGEQRVLEFGSLALSGHFSRTALDAHVHTEGVDYQLTRRDRTGSMHRVVWTNLAALEADARSHAKGRARAAWLRIDDDVTIGQLVATADAVRGSRCDKPDESDCVLPTVRLGKRPTGDALGPSLVPNHRAYHLSLRRSGKDGW